MNISSQISSLPLATVVNPSTDGLRRDNNLREVTPPPAAISPSSAEKGISSESKSAGNNNQVDNASVTQRANTKQTSVGNKNADQQEQQNSETATNQTTNQADNQDSKSSDNQQETQQELAEQQQIVALQKRDKEVKSHEAAHAAVGGSVTGAPSYSYERGPDGKNYAVNGEVSVDLSPVAGDPQATIAKMQKVHAAALAPINPSSQDKQVAAAATQAIAQAQREILNIDDSSESSAQSSRVKKDLQSNDENSTTATSTTANTERAASNENGGDFDSFINNTLKSQDTISPEISSEVKQRALRIESFYADINQAYTKPSAPQVELTA